MILRLTDTDLPRLLIGFLQGPSSCARISENSSAWAVKENPLRIMNCKKPYSDLASETGADYILESGTCTKSLECPNF